MTLFTRRPRGGAIWSDDIEANTGLLGMDIYLENTDDAPWYTVTPTPVMDIDYNDGTGGFGASSTRVREEGSFGPMVLGFADENSLFSFEADGGCGSEYTKTGWIKVGEATIIMFWDVAAACPR